MFALTLLACAGCSPSPSDTGSKTETGDSSVTSGDVTLTQGTIPTVWRVSWTTDTATDSEVVYGEGGALDHLAHGTDSEDGLSHEVLLAGLAAGVTWTGRAQSSDGSWVSGTFEIDNPAAPSDLPGMTLDSSSDTTLPGFFLAPILNEFAASISILDHEARRTWYWQGQEGELISEAWLSADGTQVWWNNMGTDPYIKHVDLDGSNEVTWSIPDLHHDFLLMPDGTVAAIEYDTRAYDGADVEGDRIVLYDADGNELRTLFSTWDHYTPDVPPEVSTYDWTHANSLYYEAERNLLWVSFYQASSLLGIDYDTGDLVYAIGGLWGDFSFEGTEDQIFARQHSPRIKGDTLTVFNNRDTDNGASDLWSEAIEYTVDWDHKTLTPLWEFDADKELSVAVLGNCDAIDDDGHRLVAFGIAGRIVELQDDAVLWQVDADLGGPGGFTHYLPELAGSVR